MRVLVTWGSKRGGTEGIGRILGDALEQQGFEVVTISADRVKGVEHFDAAIIGGALYANRWPSNVRRFVNRNAKRLRQMPVWFFSSGPLDDSADRATLAPSNQVGALAERVGALGHVTFGGRLEPGARGFPASAMAKQHSGDWRNPDRIRAWASELGTLLPLARPGKPIDHPARSIWRWLAHAVIGWALCAATMGLLLRFAGLTAALVVHAIAAPLIFAALARLYFGARGARDPLPTAFVWTTSVALLDLAVVAGLVQGTFVMFRSFAGTWLPLLLIFLVTWSVGELMSTMPWPDAAAAPTAQRAGFGGSETRRAGGNLSR